MSVLPPDWPLLEYAISWGAGPNDTSVQDLWCDVSNRTEGSTSVRRGKQYELDQVQPGEMTLTLRNDDGVFDPSNAASPFYPQVKPYRLTRLRAQYPATVNLLTADQATALYASEGSSPSGLPQWVTGIGSSQSLTCVYSASIGTNYYSVGINASAQYQGVYLTGWSVAPGGTYSAQCEASSGNGVTAQIGFDWRDASGNHISFSVAAPVALPNATTPLTVTGTAPANAVGALLFVQNTTVIAPATSMALWNFQVEQNSTASTWVQPGTWYSLFTGYVERWPQTWSSSGNYGTIAVDAVDLFAFLANTPLNYTAYSEILALGPNWFYPLDETSGTSLLHDQTGRTAAPAVLAGIAASGNTLANTAGYLPIGIPGPVVTINNTTSSQTGEIQLQNGGPPATTAWTRVYAWNPGSTLPTQSGPNLWLASPLNNELAADTNGPFYELYVSAAGQLQFGIIKPAGTVVVSSPTLGLVFDGGWHLIAVTMSSDGLTVGVYLDGAQVYATTVASDTRLDCSQGIDVLGGPYGANIIPSAVSVSYAFAAELPYAATATQMSNLYEAFRYAWETTQSHTETSGARYSRILGWIGYAGPTRIDTGSSVDYGPATDIQGGGNPTYALDALTNVVTSESGQHFIAADGTVVFQARTERYNPTAAVTFGEHAGEVPYTNAKMDFDPTRVANTIEVDAQQGNTPHFATDSTSINDYGAVGLQQTVNSMSSEELQDAAGYLLYQNKQPLQRLEALPVDVGANPAVWSQLLGLDLGTAVAVNRRPSGAPTMSEVGYVEQVQWSIDDQRKATWTAQVSNAAFHYFGALDDSTYGKFDSTLIFGY